MKYKFPEPTLESVKQKLNWGQNQVMFSTDLNPKECAFVLTLLTKAEELLWKPKRKKKT